jgi:Helicase associated domain
VCSLFSVSNHFVSECLVVLSERRLSFLSRPTSTQKHSSTECGRVFNSMAMDSSGDKISATSCLETDAIEKQKISPTPPEENSEGDEKMTGEKQGGLADAKWEDMFNRLVAYKKKHGDCLVPNRHPEDPQLGSWGKSLFLASHCSIDSAAKCDFQDRHLRVWVSP